MSLECGGRPGGHGHPDLLHVTLRWAGPWLLDFGTGSYVSPSLRWYRSTLAHNAPGVAGTGQLSRDGACEAFSAVDDWAWMRARASDVFGARYSATRTLVAGPDWVLDRVTTRLPMCSYFTPVGSFSLKSYSLDPYKTTERVTLCSGASAVAPYAGPCPPK